MTFSGRLVILFLSLASLAFCQELIDTRLPYVILHHQHHFHGRNYFVFDPANRPIVCNRGQVYWCQNITTAASCGAVKHCIQAVWEKEVPIENDPSEACKVCLDMVKQARDQLLSNQTQEELLEVLDGTCKLVPVKAIKEECMKVMSEFAPYIVDTLASQMNPQVVCSVAGLCNNENEEDTAQLTCNSCRSLVYRMEDMIETAHQEDVFVFMANMCGQMGSYSDICTSLSHVNAPRFHAFLKSSFKAKPVCMLSGVCGSKFHTHEPKTDVVDEREIELSDSMACDFCLQLVSHLKDVLIASTTEEEFLQVLKGLCNQMKGYKDECTNLVEEYYHPLYEFLVHELDGKFFCSEINICPNPSNKVVRPLLLHGNPYSKNSKAEESQAFARPEEAQLPIERLNPLTFLPEQMVIPQNSMVCQVCQYVLHFLQEEITLPSTEDEIRDAIVKACKTLPKSVEPQCESFVNDYIDAVIALIAHDIDPSQVCPELKLCPSSLVAVPYLDKQFCPLCLLAFQEVTMLSQNNKTAVAVYDILDRLCTRQTFHKSVVNECSQFINSYKDKLTDMIISEFSPQEACVFIGECVPHGFPANHKEIESAGNVLTNEIMDHEDPHYKKVNLPVVCRFCKTFMHKFSKLIDTPTNEEAVKAALKKICSLMPGDMQEGCSGFVNKYEDLIVRLALDDSLVDLCYLTGVCFASHSPSSTPSHRAEVSKTECLLCELLMDGLKTVLTDKDVDDDINKNLRLACQYLPRRDTSMCLNLVEQLAPQIEEALRTLPVGPLVCRRIGSCKEMVPIDGIRLFEGTKCHLGPNYYCLSEERAKECGALLHCQRHVWKGIHPKERHNKGTVTI